MCQSLSYLSTTVIFNFSTVIFKETKFYRKYVDICITLVKTGTLQLSDNMALVQLSPSYWSGPSDELLVTHTIFVCSLEGPTTSMYRLRARCHFFLLLVHLRKEMAEWWGKVPHMWRRFIVLTHGLSLTVIHYLNSLCSLCLLLWSWVWPQQGYLDLLLLAMRFQLSESWI